MFAHALAPRDKIIGIGGSLTGEHGSVTVDFGDAESLRTPAVPPPSDQATSQSLPASVRSARMASPADR